MAQTLVFVLSKEPDFAEALTEQVQRELAVDCRVIGSASEAKEAALVIAQEMPEGLRCPVLVIKDRPVRLQAVLNEAEALLQKSTTDRLRLAADYKLQPRLKQVVHASGKVADVTDKEIRLLQVLAEAGSGGMAKEELLRQVWGFEEALDTHTLETHIYRLRAKFRELAGEEMIAAVEGGYRLEGDD